MKLTELKNKIVSHLSNLTIDDFYADPNLSFAKETFAELTNQKSEEQIKKYLIDKFPETTVEAKRFNLEQKIMELNDQIATFNNTINIFQIEINNLEKQTADKKEKQTAIPKKKSQVEDEIIEIQTEIQHIKHLANKPPYIKQMEDLEKSKEKKKKELESFPASLDQLKKEISELEAKTEEVKDNITKNEAETKAIQTSINKFQRELKQLSEKENSHYKKEYSSLEFLFKILLKISIAKREEIEYQKTGKKIKNNFNFQSYDEEVPVKTGEVTLVIDHLRFEEYKEFVLAFMNKKNIIPNGWRKLLDQILSAPLPNLAGTISNVTNSEHDYFDKKNLELSNKDISTLLAMKIAVRTKHSVKTADNKIILGLSGGLSAKIAFREKGVLIAKFQMQKLEIYSKCFFSRRFVEHTLYHQTGYANSTINIETPGAYYILEDKFVIEIDFNAAPILFDSNSVIKFAPNISGKAKEEDEIAEEERRRQQEEDDLYDDDY